MEQSNNLETLTNQQKPINLGEMFLDDNYTIEALLKQTQENNLTLKQLRDYLIKHLQQFNQTSLDLFNNSYDRFYKLSYIIACLSEPMQHLLNPLQTFKDQLTRLCDHHSAYVTTIDNKLELLKNTSKNKEFATHLISLIKKRDTLEQQLNSIDWSLKIDNSLQSCNDHSMNSKQIKYDLIERLDIELYYLICQVRAIKPTHDELIPIKKSLENSLEERQCQLDDWFKDKFLDSINSRSKYVIDLIIVIYKQKNSMFKLETIWKDKVVKPYLELSLTDAVLTEQKTGETFKLLKQFLEDQLTLIETPFLVPAFWQEVVNSLEKLTKLYSLFELETFKCRYLETRTFLEEQNHYKLDDNDNERNKVGITDKEIKRNCTKIMSKFNILGYYNHRLSQIASSVELTFTQQPLSKLTALTNPQSHEEKVMSQFHLKVCMHIYVLVTKCWSPELYIDTLEIEFTQLACRILNRFANWLSKLRLSDFRIISSIETDTNKQTNFLAKQDAIMRLLIEDCDRLTKSIGQFIDSVDGNTDKNLVKIRSSLFDESFKLLNEGLNNVRSLQHLIER